MSDRKNNFDFSRQSWPKQPSAERVVGERGRKELPPGTKGGENMKPDRHAEHKQHAFDSFCKKVLKCEACNGYREISRRKKHSIPFSELPEDAMEQLAAYDRYPWEYNTFILGGDVILIENDLLADALNALPQDNRDIMQDKATNPGKTSRPEKNPLDAKTTYHIGNRSFVVEPVFKEESPDTLGSVLLRLMKSESEKL